MQQFQENFYASNPRIRLSTNFISLKQEFLSYKKAQLCEHPEEKYK